MGELGRCDWAVPFSGGVCLPLVMVVAVPMPLVGGRREGADDVEEATVDVGDNLRWLSFVSFNQALQFSSSKSVGWGRLISACAKWASSCANVRVVATSHSRWPICSVFFHEVVSNRILTSVPSWVDQSTGQFQAIPFSFSSCVMTLSLRSRRFRAL